MANRTDEIRDILAHATKAAYDQGWNDAIAAFKMAVADGSAMPQAEPETIPGEFTHIAVNQVGKRRRRRGGRPNNSEQMVGATIAMHPGLTGAEVAELLPNIHERTVRTGLRRLRIDNKIEQREKRWYPVSGGT